MNRIRYIAVHPFNDFSGSPRVLADFCTAQAIQSQSLTMITSVRDGFIGQGGDDKHTIWYPQASWMPWKALFFIVAQIQCWVMVCFLCIRSRRAGERVVVISNTINSMGAMIASRCMGALTVVYIHELASRPKLLKKIAEWVIRQTADEVLMVSSVIHHHYCLGSCRVSMLPNGLRADFSVSPTLDRAAKQARGSVLFVGSLKFYKGVNEFLKIAHKMPEITFEAVFNCTERELTQFQFAENIPHNLQMHARHPNLQEKYRRAFVVVNLSLAPMCVETFALTVLEGLSAGCPCVVPPSGGHLDYFNDGVGRAIDGRDTDGIVGFIRQLRADRDYWYRCSDNARRIARDYSTEHYRARVDEFLRVIQHRHFSP